MIVIFLMSFVSSSFAIGGYDGVVQSPGIGEYCVEYFNKLTYNIDDYSPSSQCRPCFDYYEKTCPWNCGSSCFMVSEEFLMEYYMFKTVFECLGGCLFTAECTAVDDGYFTSSGVTVGDASSCQFACNTGYSKSGSTCVSNSACGAGQYKLNGVCTQCRTCDNGFWLDGCTGTNSGVCLECTN